MAVYAESNLVVLVERGVERAEWVRTAKSKQKKSKKMSQFLEGIKVKKVDSGQGKGYPAVPMYIHLVRWNMYRKLSKPKPGVNLAVVTEI